MKLQKTQRIFAEQIYFMPKSNCYHCGLECENELIEFDEKSFCCNGCKSVYEILNINNLTDFYELNKGAGIRPDNKANVFEYLDAEAVFNKVIDFSENGITLVTFKIPVIHCSSCVWLLESLQDFNKNITYSQVNFTNKTVQITYKSDDYKLSDLAKFLTNLGYKPVINLETADQKKPENVDKNLIIKLAIAGFAFGNVMLLTLPEYLDNTDFWFLHYRKFFRWIIFLLSLPVFFYSATDYYKSAWIGLKNKIINIDVPISIGIIVLFTRSCYEAYYDISSGYFDSLCGLLFFMLIGKYFQQRTYKALAFDRDYKSFYPIAVTRITFGTQENILLSELKKGDRILIRNQEMIPADSILIKGDANIDNSFITGEANLIRKEVGNKIFAGGKQNGTLLELEVIKEVNQSFLTQLWNKNSFRKTHSYIDSLTTNASKYFTYIILAITIFAALYWYFVDVSKMFQVITAILIVACPCALALSAPFTFGNMMRIFGRKNLYVKDVHTIEKMAKINHIVFDKTGTITLGNESDIQYVGEDLNDDEKSALASLFKNSTHPLSRLLNAYLKAQDEFLPIENFEEQAGKGISGKVKNYFIKAGSAIFTNSIKTQNVETAVFVSINEHFKGKFVFTNQYRNGITTLFQSLNNYKLSLVSGDNESEKATIEKRFPMLANLRFNQSPENKMEFIETLQKNGENVMMLGDGLNDAGALKQSNIGIAIAEEIHNFTPASDAILQGNKVIDLPKFLQLSKKSLQIVTISFTISFLYNIVGLSFAISGNLSPLVAAILMPISSISVVSFTTFATWLVSRNS